MNAWLRPVDDWLNEFTMYRFLVYGLVGLASLALIFSAGGALTLNFSGLVASLAVLLAASYGSNFVISRLYKAPTNYESWLISALILFFILPTVRNTTDALIWALAAAIAMASKYILAPWRKHIFNPAACGAAFIAATGLGYSSWWIGSAPMLPFTLVLSVLVARKIRRLRLVSLFWAASLIVTVLAAVAGKLDIGDALQLAIVSGPLVFLGGIMLTEPATMPSRDRWRWAFAMVVAILFVTHWQIGPTSISPEMALLSGNLLAFLVSPKKRLSLKFEGHDELGDGIYEYRFKASEKPQFTAGQYAEWTLPHRRPDSRGNRRTFSLASAPGDTVVRLGIKQAERPSSFKTALAGLKPGDRIQLGPAAGDFILPSDPQSKALFIAGGIGITPFASMLRQILADNIRRDIVLYYSVRREDELAYKGLREKAGAIGVRIETSTGKLDRAALSQAVPDIASRQVYISGSPQMVRAAQDMAAASGVPARHVHTDFFSGY